ncbi:MULTISPECIES: alpha/beta fold hydrolase [Citrobacter]|uniref:Alpha/beta fold hydrolase n=1 Tax=Citrobacter pasteurii TaxID=1563222 RepID=A0A6N6K9X4_9ENTR|nr:MULTISPECIES: alpha/beta fold hydrolase [Citrobacter]EIQ75445.1 alpha/beta hydrolase [Shigella flexneri 1235-66]KAA1278961.1 alpha/beta fold hydrolase [Citrobacter pasteurii]MBA4712016.1 alpha/beta fold hydrolase [Citrobacter pasteurii]MBA7943792.1 alpha/beta fold hydrolase [Citrobacter sp. RHBSTW-00271]MBD0802699.1 alpha/beta fold hydrolase [Citrobacter sp. C6_1]
MNITTSIALLSACPFVSLAAAPVTFSETTLDATGPKGPLKGTLLTPSSKPTAIVLIVPGSGPTDRDGNNPLGVNASPYRLLAEALVAKGFATLRIDKRGMFASVMAVEDANAVTIADYVDDVRSWLKVLKREMQTSCVWVLGHSEGGVVALAAAQEQDVCGVVLIAMPGRPMGEVLRGQLKANPANALLLNEALPIIDALEHRRRVDTTNIHPALQNLFNPSVQGFLINAFSYNPSHLISTISKPVLVLQGQRDLQVEETDARMLKAANPQASLVLLPNMNHVMKEVTSDDRKANISSYAEPALPLAPGLVDSIEHFLIHNSHFPEK